MNRNNNNLLVLVFMFFFFFLLILLYIVSPSGLLVYLGIKNRFAFPFFALKYLNCLYMCMLTVGRRCSPLSCI